MAGIPLTGLSGAAYLYHECSPAAQWRQVPGNYAFLDSRNGPVYIGQTGDFSTRRPGPAHETWAAAQRYGAVKVVARENQGGEAARKAEEADLIRAYDPPANQQLRLSPAASPLRRVAPTGLLSQANRKTLLGGS